MTNPAITILDGGMGRELERIGAPFRQPEWSALALLEGPEWVVQAHQNFVQAGAQVITTNSYACVPFHLGEERFLQRGRELAALSGELARKVANESTGVRVAGSIPPLFGSYRPDLFDPTNAVYISSVLIDALAPSIDHWLVETISSILEAQSTLTAIRDFGDVTAVRPRWVSFTLDDVLHDGSAVLRSGESITAAVEAIGDQIEALLFNCSQPEVMAVALREASAARSERELRLGVYANAFATARDDDAPEANEGLSVIRKDLTPVRYRSFAEEWAAAGATIIGGCCGVGPEHIAEVCTLR
jgi:S-methylmethionine-dependent homocysteine/selenocysteine methylase